MHYKTLNLTSQIPVSYIGPDWQDGPLPALFYFSLSAEESLCLDPYNQPVAFLSDYPLRIFSLDLPGHGKELRAIEAMKVWAHEIAQGHNFVSPFVAQVELAVNELVQREVIDSEKLGVAGLSRGGFIAAHVAAQIPLFRSILGFAPLTKLSYAKEFEQLQEQPLANSLNLDLLIPSLIGHPVRFYIGNRDTRVGTAHCFQFIESLADASFQARIRPPQVELIISPSIGLHGHGTSPPIFIEGAKWMLTQLGIAHG